MNYLNFENNIENIVEHNIQKNINENIIYLNNTFDSIKNNNNYAYYFCYRYENIQYLQKIFNRNIEYENASLMNHQLVSINKDLLIIHDVCSSSETFVAFPNMVFVTGIVAKLYKEEIIKLIEDIDKNKYFYIRYTNCYIEKNNFNDVDFSDMDEYFDANLIFQNKRNINTYIMQFSSNYYEQIMYEKVSETILEERYKIMLNRISLLNISDDKIHFYEKRLKLDNENTFDMLNNDNGNDFFENNNQIKSYDELFIQFYIGFDFKKMYSWTKSIGYY